MRPVISSSQELALRNSTESGGRYPVASGTPAILRFSVESSGDASPYVTHMVDWGDGNTATSGEPLPVGREFQYSHDYGDAVGEYTVRVTVTNGSGERSAEDPFSVLAVRVDPVPERQVRPFKWRGIALPVGKIGAGLEVVERSYPISVLELAVAAAAGDRSIVLVGGGDDLARGAMVTVTEAGKMTTAARVVGASLNVAELDTALNDAYGRGARVEVARRDVGRSFSPDVPARATSWYFPGSEDEDLVRSSVAMILATRPGERPFRYSIGSRIHELPFEPNDPITAAQVTAYVPDELEEQEPRVKVNRTSVEAQDGELYLRTELEFAVGDDSPFNVSLPLREGFGVPITTVGASTSA